MVMLVVLILLIGFQERPTPPAPERGPGFGPCNNPGQSRPPFCDEDPDEIPLSENAAFYVLLIGGLYGVYKLKKRET